MRMPKFSIIIAAIMMLSDFIFALSPEVKMTLPADIMAVGGTGVTSYDKFSMIYMNPAAFALPQFAKISILKLGGSLNYDLFNMYNVLKDVKDFTNLTQEQWKTVLNLSARGGVTGPLAVGYIWERIGFLLYDDALVTATIKQAPGIPYIDFGSYLDLGFLFGFGFEIPMPVFMGKFTKAYGGINIKYINRFKVENHRMSIPEFVDTGLSIMNFEKGFLWGQAIGSDVGFMVKGESLAFGFVLRDWFTTQFTWKEYDRNFKLIGTNDHSPTFFYPSFDVGVSYKIRKLLERYLISDITFSMDLVDVFNFSENYWLKTRFGFEVTAFTILKFRVGVYKGYPTFGLGLMIFFINVDATYFTEELGTLPGSKPQQVIMAEVKITF